MEEREIPGWSRYRAREDGLIIGPSGRVLKPRVKKRTRHLRVRLYGESGHLVQKGKTARFSDIYVHRLVCLAWHGRPAEEQTLVRHLDGNPQNNRPDNLCWGTVQENANDFWACEESVHRWNERLGMQGDHRHYEVDLFIGF